MADIVERRSPPRPGMPWGQTHDYLGCVDIVAIGPDETLAVQSCGSSFSAHLKKLTIDCAHEVREWLRGACRKCGEPMRRLELWGWRKVKAKRGGRLMVWRPRVQEITLEDVATADDDEGTS